MEERLSKLCIDIDKISKKEYLKQGYVPKKTEVKLTKSTVKEKEVEIEINKMKGTIHKMIQHKEQKTNKKIENKSENSMFMDNTSDAFNIVDDDKHYLEWRKLSVEDRLLILEEFMEDKDYDEELQNILRIYVESGKILFRKDIHFDKINRKILELPLVKYINGKYIIKEDEKKVNVKKQNMNNINKLLKTNK